MILRAGLVLLLFAGWCGFSPPELAGAGLPISNLTPGAALASSVDDLQQGCLHLDRLDGEPPRLPTTRQEDAFLACQVTDGMIGLSYSDGTLVLVQLQGAALVERLTADLQAGEEPVPYAGMDIYPSVALSVDRASGQAWLLSPSHLHTHLFLLDHPLLTGATTLAPTGTVEALLPADLAIGMDLAAARTSLAVHCPLFEERRIEPVTLPGDVDAQVQIDCFGLDVAGHARKAEFVFGDGRLQLIWLLTGQEEQERVRAYLSDRRGAPLEESDRYIIWPNGLALRKDVPEILIAAPDVATALTGQ